MYAAMQSAPLGDDVLGDEPTVTELEELAAQMTGKEKALFVPSGTMGNQIAIATHTRPGDAIIVEEEAHVIYYEVGAPAIFANVLTWTLASGNGILDPNLIDSRVTKANLHTPGTTLLCLENTHNRAGGTCIPLSNHKKYRQVADRHGLKIHVDGARLFNASVAQNVPLSELLTEVDTVSICLSKGLCAPVGSLLVGPAEFIERARIWRKRMGGGMRQSGILAACGLVSLHSMVNRLAEDHARCARLASEIGGMAGFGTRVPETNICLIETESPAAEIQQKLHQLGVWCFPVAANRIRLVTHHDVNDAGVAHAIDAFHSVSSSKI
jgi:threonine aldolase